MKTPFMAIGVEMLRECPLAGNRHLFRGVQFTLVTHTSPGPYRRDNIRITWR